MQKSLGKVILVVVIAGLLTGSIAVASAATKVRTVTTSQGTTVDILSITGTVTAVSDPETNSGFFGRFRRRHVEATITDDADGKTYTLEMGPVEAGAITMKVGDKVTVEGTVATRGSKNVVHVWTFTGADGKTVTLRKDDGTPNIETVTVEGEVTEVNRDSASGTDTRPPKSLDTIKVRESDGTEVTVVLGRAGDRISVNVGDKVKVTGFTTPMSATTVMATEFTGADGTTVTLRHLDDVPHGPISAAETVSVEGSVTKISLNEEDDDAAARRKGEPFGTIDIAKADGSSVTVVLGRSVQSISVNVGDKVKVTGVQSPGDATTIIATEFTGADGTTIQLRGPGRAGRGRGAGEGPRGWSGGTCPTGLAGTDS